MEFPLREAAGMLGCLLDIFFSDSKGYLQLYAVEFTSILTNSLT